ncbi:MAG: hypothetical protein KAJ40_00570 [Alphaproteobacteria bacterium]|nr:hypothetical protein [Alphaproteobacteria bacterium]
MFSKNRSIFYILLFSYLSYFMSFIVDGDEVGDDADTFDDIQMDTVDSNDGNDGEGKVTHEDDPKPDPKDGDAIPNSIDNKQAKAQADSKKAAESGKPSDEEVAEVIDYLKGKYGDTDYEMHPETVFSLGEDNDVSIQDLVESYRTGEEFDTEYDKFGNDRLSFDQERRGHMSQLERSRAIESQFNNLREMANGENMADSFFHIFDSLGLNGNNVYEALVGKLFPDLSNAVGTMDEVEFRNYMLHNQNEFMSKFHGVQTQRVTQERQRNELATEIAGVKRQHGISDEGYQDAFNRISKMKADGNLKFEFNTANIGQVALQMYVDRTASELLEGIHKGLSRDQNLMSDLVEMMDKDRTELGRNFNDEELEAIEQSILANFDLEVDSVAKTNKKKLDARRKVTTKKTELVDDTFDDLEEQFSS